MTEPIGAGRAFLIVATVLVVTLAVGTAFGFLAAALLP